VAVVAAVVINLLHIRLHHQRRLPQVTSTTVDDHGKAVNPPLRRHHHLWDTCRILEHLKPVEIQHVVTYHLNKLWIDKNNTCAQHGKLWMVRVKQKLLFFAISNFSPYSHTNIRTCIIPHIFFAFLNP
jgi:hypothetical protein